MTDEAEILLDVAVLGEQIEQFLKSDIGKYLSEHAEEVISEGMNELKVADCNDAKAVWTAQNKVWLGERFRHWIKEAVTAGLKAREILEERE